MVLIESAFHSYQEIAQEKLSNFWLTWPFHWLARLLISDELSPCRAPQAILKPDVPIILLYSKNDKTIPIDQGEKFFRELRDPKEFWQIDEPGHINRFDTEDRRFRKKFVDRLREFLI